MKITTKTTKLTGAIVFVLLLAVTVSAYSIPPADNSLEITTWELDQGRNLAPSITTNDGKILLAYHAGSDLSKFTYSANSGNSWSTPIILSIGTELPSIAASGNSFYITYHYAPSRDLRFISSADYGQTLTNFIDIETEGIVGFEHAVTSPVENVVYVAYGSGGVIKFTKSTNAGQTWTSPITMDSNYFARRGISISAPTPSVVYVTYHETMNNKLYLAKSTNAGQTWITSTINPPTQGGFSSSITASPTGTIYVSYLTTLSSANSNLVFAKSTNAGQTWTFSTIDVAGLRGTSIQAQGDTISIAYQHRSGSLNIARSTDAGQTWTTKVIDTDRSYFPSLTSADSTTMYIAYNNDITDTLNVARVFFVDAAIPGDTSPPPDTTDDQQPSTIPSGWYRATGPQYPSFGDDPITVEDVYSRTNVVKIEDTDTAYTLGIVSDLHPVAADKPVYAAVDVYCDAGIGELVLELWEGDTRVTSPATATSTKVDEWERISVQSLSTQSTTSATILLKSGGITDQGTCYFDNAQLEVLANENTAPSDYATQPPIIGPLACCPATSCWSGNECVIDMSAAPDAEPINDYRCIAGDWVYSPRVFTPDKSQSGFCPEASQCLIDPNGDESLNSMPEEFYQGNNPQCINDEQYIFDNLCEGGQWTTRTKILSLELLDLVDETADQTAPTYTMFCDSYDKSLVEPGEALQYILPQTGGIFGQNCFEAIDGSACVNNFCVLKYTEQGGDEKRVLGVSLNKDIDDDNSFLEALNKPNDHCDNIPSTSTTFEKCSGDETTWYNPSTNSIIYSRDEVNLNGLPGWQRALQWLLTPIQNLVNWVTGTPTQSAVTDVDFVRNISQYNKLYVFSAPSQHINAIYEDVGEHSFVLASYTGFESNICRYVNNKARLSGINQDISRISVTCTESGDKYTSYSTSGGTNFQIEEGKGYWLAGCTGTQQKTLTNTQIQPPTGTQTTTVQLKEGANLWSMPLKTLTDPIEEEPIQTASDLLLTIDRQNSNAQCRELYRWTGASWQIHIFGTTTQDFTLNPSEGYFLICDNPAIIFLEGEPFTNEGTITIKSTNLINIPVYSNPSAPLLASNILSQINANGEQCTTLEELSGIDFNVFTEDEDGLVLWQELTSQLRIR